MTCFGTPRRLLFHYEEQWDRVTRVTAAGFVLYGPLRADGGW